VVEQNGIALGHGEPFRSLRIPSPAVVVVAQRQRRPQTERFGGFSRSRSAQLRVCVSGTFPLQSPRKLFEIVNRESSAGRTAGGTMGFPRRAGTHHRADKRHGSRESKEPAEKSHGRRSSAAERAKDRGIRRVLRCSLRRESPPSSDGSNPPGGREWRESD